MATNIETLKKPNGDKVLPRTRAKAVSMENGTTVEAAIIDITEQLKTCPDANSVVSINQQSLTDAQKAQVRANIGVTGYYCTEREELDISYEDVNASYVLGLYDSLMEQYPDKVAKNEVYNNDKTFTNYEYIISTGEYNDEGIRESTLDTDIKKPKYLILSGIHGSERPNALSAYRFVRDMLNGHSAIAHLGEGAIIRIIPVGNPYGFDNFLYENANGVNINRDFASETFANETQVLANWLRDNSDAELFLDFHNQSVVNEVVTIFGIADSAISDRVKKIALRGVDRIIPYWRDTIKYSKTLWCRPLTGNETDVVEQPVIFSNSVSIDIPGSAIQYATNILDIPSIALEASVYQNGNYLDWCANKKICTPETIAAGAEVLGNILIEIYEQFVFGEVIEMTQSIDNKLDSIVESINSISKGFRVESGVMVFNEDVLPASGSSSITIKIPCSPGAKTVDFHADTATLTAIKATTGKNYLASALANCYAPNIVNEAGQMRGLCMAQKYYETHGWVLDHGSIRADNSDGLSFFCSALLAGTYNWTAYYWND